VIALHDLFPGRSIAPNAAMDQQSDNLGFFQNGLRKFPVDRPKTSGCCRSEVRGNLTAHTRYVSVEQEVSSYQGARDCSRHAIREIADTSSGCADVTSSVQLNGDSVREFSRLSDLRLMQNRSRRIGFVAFVEACGGICACDRLNSHWRRWLVPPRSGLLESKT
jgi:hypothetical protein